MIDLHSHLLPAVDDGSRSTLQSTNVLREMAKAGVSDICLTPHLRADQVEAGPPAKHDRAFEELKAAAPQLPRLHRGAEVMLDRPLGKEAGRSAGSRSPAPATSWSSSPGSSLSAR